MAAVHFSARALQRESDRSITVPALAGVARREAGLIDHSLLSSMELLEPQPSHYWYSLGPNDSFCALQLWTWQFLNGLLLL